jgi:hypothetical protein
MMLHAIAAAPPERHDAKGGAAEENGRCLSCVRMIY